MPTFRPAKLLTNELFPLPNLVHHLDDWRSTTDPIAGVYTVGTPREAKFYDPS